MTSRIPLMKPKIFAIPAAEIEVMKAKHAGISDNLVPDWSRMSPGSGDEASEQGRLTDHFTMPVLDLTKRARR